MSSFPPTADLGAVLLRPPTPDECSTLAEALAVMPPWSVLDVSADGLAQFLTLEDQSARRYAVIKDGELAGTVAVRHPWLKGPYVELMAVLPAFQGQGVGSAALGFVEDEAARRGARNVWVCASRFNDAALRFYTRCGFVSVATLPGLVADGFDEILLRKTLD